MVFSQFSKSNKLFWFSLSITFALVYGLLALKEGFSSEWIVQDDARQHVFWTLRYVNTELFPNDLIADYFQSVAPLGYTSLYRLAATIGINPLVFNKFLPLGIGVVTTAYCFSLCRQIFPVSFACFLSSLILNQIIWMRDGIVSGTPKAFAFPLLLAFLYYLSKRALFPCLITIVLLGAFYPQGVLLASGMLFLQLFSWQVEHLRFAPLRKEDYYFCGIGLGVAVAVMLPYAISSSEFAPVITVEQAKQLPEFFPKGRAAFFRENWYDFYLLGGRAGIIPNGILNPATNIFGFFLPLLGRFPQRFPLLAKIQPKIVILPQLIVVSVIMFITAHLLLFRLHLPSRYTGYSFLIIMAFATGITLSIIIDSLLDVIHNHIPNILMEFKLFTKKIFALMALVMISIIVFGYPSFLNTFPVTLYKTGASPKLYQFLQKQPENILIASLTADTDNIPTFAQRSILVGSEYAIPYHWGYYSLFRQRIIDLINAQYTNNPDLLRQFISRYGVDFWIVENASFTPAYLVNNRWLQQYQLATQTAIEHLEQNKLPILAKYKDSCTVFAQDSIEVIATKCLLIELYR